MQQVVDLDRVLSEVDKVCEPKEAIWFNISRDKTTVFDSKLGGVPYFPADMEYPISEDGKPLLLLAQINFDNVPKLKDFPSTGILQFFIKPGDAYGLFEKDGYRVIYHSDVQRSAKRLAVYDYECENKYDLPFTGSYKLTVDNRNYMFADIYTDKFCDVFVEKYNLLTDGSLKSVYDVDDDTFHKLAMRNSRGNAHIGGYPVFTQYDPRKKSEYADYDIVIFELDSFYDKEKGFDIMWGDCGVGNFFMTNNQLRNLEFAKVLYNWDCG